MNDKNNIERLFQERFKDFEPSPPENSWQHIAAQLEKKKSKKRVLPFWFKATGIAAGFVIGYFVLNNVMQDTPAFENNKKVVQKTNNAKSNDNSPTENNIKNRKVEKELPTFITKEKIAVLDEESSDGKEANNQTNEEQIIPNTKNINQEQSVANKESYARSNKNSNTTYVNNNSIVNRNVEKKFPTSIETEEVAVLDNESSDGKQENVILNKESYLLTNKNSKTSNAKKNSIVNNSTYKNTPNKTTKINTAGFISNSNSIIANNATIKTDKEKTNSLDYNSQTDRLNSENKIVVDNSTLENNKKSSTNKNPFIEKNSTPNLDKDENNKGNTITNKENNIIPDKKSQEGLFYSTELKKNTIVTSPSINENTIAYNSLTSKNTIINQDKNIEELNDSILKLATTENALEKLLLEKETKITEEIIPEKNNQWKVRPNVAPVFMNATSGSPLDMRFADNNKSYDSNLSVGVGIDYDISNKFTFRTGINQFDLSYNTNDVAFYANINAFNAGSTGAKGMTTVNFAQTASLMTIIDNNRNAGAVDNEIGQNKKTGAINQRIGYLEFPIEISYKLIDKKFGIQMFTGFSTLILNENSISLFSNNSKTDIGEANNLNPIHFSTNVGIAFKYNFWKSFEVNFEPTFKYQMATFNTNAGGFKPYFIGLYSGVSLKF